MHFPQTEGGLRRFEPPTLPARNAAALGDASGPGASAPKKIATKLHLNWGRASARQLKRVLVDVGGDTQKLLGRAGKVLSQREICRAFGKAPQLPIAGTSSASLLFGKLQEILLFSDEATALHSMDTCAKIPLLNQVPSPKRGVLSRARELRLLADPRQFRRMMEANGITRFEQIFARGETKRSSHRGRAPARGSWNGGTGSRGESTTARRRMTDSLAGRFPAIPSSA